MTGTGQSSTDRIIFEVRYFARARREDAHGVCPEVLDFDEAERILVLEDLGRAERLDAALAREADVEDALARVAAFLGRIHGAQAPHLPG